MNPVDFVIGLLFAVSLLFTSVLSAIAFRQGEAAHDRIDEIEGDFRIDRIEGVRAYGAMMQTANDLDLLEGFDPSVDGRTIVSEWTRPDYRDERVPEPVRNRRGFIPW